MSVEFKAGDIFATDGLTAFAHGCNCAGAMGKGIAIAFKERWPQMYLEYKKRCFAGEFNPGDVFVWEENGECVFNLGTQKTWRTKAKLGAIETSLERMLSLAEEMEMRQIALPRIGAGLGGLEWNAVKSAIQRIGEASDIQLIVCEDFVQGLPIA